MRSGVYTTCGPPVVPQLKELIKAVAVTPVIDRRYPMEQIADAFRYVETTGNVGNVVIMVSQDRDPQYGEGETR